MIILHAAASEERLLLWGESLEGSPIDCEELVRATATARIGGGTVVGRVGKATAWLPIRDGRPVSSLAPAETSSGSRAKATLVPWEAAVCPLLAAEAVDLLRRCMGRRTLASGIVLGADVAYWTQALRFVGALVARQRFLPGLVNGAMGPLAVWSPVLIGSDADRLVNLAGRMPPCARALTENGGSRPPAVFAASVLGRFVATSVDCLVRLAISGTGDHVRAQTPPAFDSPHDAWLAALRSPDGQVFAANKREFVRIAADIAEWQWPLSVVEKTPFRLCFRLEEPLGEPTGPGERPAPGEGDTWFLRYLLQSLDDPSLLVATAEAWRSRGDTASLLTRGDWNPEEYVLIALGQAASLCPDIAASLREPGTEGCPLDTGSAHQFLTERAVALEEAGFGVMLPAWWTRKGTKTKLAVRARVRSPSLRAAGGFSLDQIVEVDWTVALDDTAITSSEMETLAKAKAPLVRLRGQWVQLDASEIRAAAEFWRTRTQGKVAAREVVRMAVGAEDAPAGFQFGGVEATGWIRDLIDSLEGQTGFADIAPPAGLTGTLRPYQTRGYSWLAFLRRWGLGACLADDMGLGKTIQTLALIQRDWEANEESGRSPVLIVCPTSVIDNWRKEAARFTPGLTVMVHHGEMRTKGAAFKKAARRCAVVLSSYSLLHRDIRLFQGMEWAGVILDEAQNIKNAETKQSRAARSIRAGYRVALTGTPVENNVGDLWSIIEFLNPGLLGSSTQFRREFLLPIQAERDEVAAQRLKRVTGPFILRRLKSDLSIISDLPEKQETKVYCRLTREQASLYAAVLKDMEAALESTEGIERKGLILSTLTRLKQVCNHPAHFLGDNSPIPGRSGKLARLSEMLDEILDTGERALVFTQFAEMGRLLQSYLRERFGREILFLHGGVPRTRRDQMVERFQAGAAASVAPGTAASGTGWAPGDPQGPRVLVLSLKAGGTGLNLTAANHVFHFDRWWNPAVEDQATDRVFRIGQKRGVLVHKFVCAGTLEERIDEMIERKRDIAGKVVGTGEAWLTELSDRQLRDILALRTETET